jgi:glycosyltransferase involved in cell wall biosynthesis
VKPAGRTRIAFLITSLEVGGSERQLVALLRGLPDAGFEKHLICLSGYGPLEAEARATGAAVHDLQYPRLRGAGTIQWRNLPAAAMTVLRLAGLLRRIKPDVLHTMIPVCNVLGAVAGRMARVPRLACTKLALGAYRDKSRVLPKLEDFVDPWFHLVHCKSVGILEDIAEREPIPRKRMRVVYNGIATTRFDGVDARASVRHEFGIPEDAFLAGMVANLIPYKGHTEVVSAASEVIREHPGAHFLFAGRDDGIGTRLKEQAASLGISERIILAGIRSDIPELMSAMDLLVCASHEEGFSNVLLEAMACGLPIVATRVGGNPEAVEDGVTGILVDPRAPAQISRAIGQIVGDPPSAREMGARGRERVRRLFSYEAMIDGMTAFYRELLS